MTKDKNIDDERRYALGRLLLEHLQIFLVIFCPVGYLWRIDESVGQVDQSLFSMRSFSFISMK